MVLHADGAVSINQDARGLAARANDQVRARTSGFQVGFGSAPSPASGGRCLVVADPFLLRPIEIVSPRDAEAFRRRDHRICQWRSRYRIRHVQRATDAVQGARATLLILSLLEKGKHTVPVPANAAPLTPLVVILRVAAHVDHAVD